MLLTISTTYQPADDLGFLLHKNPARLQMEELSFGKAYVFYPDVEPNLCTVALLIEVDSVALVRGRGPAGEGGQLEQYVNDRPYSANSFLSVAMGRLFATAMSGRSKERPELAAMQIPLSASLPVVAAVVERSWCGACSSRWAMRWTSKVHRWTASFRFGVPRPMSRSHSQRQ